MTIKIKVPVKDIEKGDIENKILDKLKNNPTDAYTISGLMIEIFNVKEQDISNKPFSNWKKGQPTLYTKIRLTLEKMLKKEIIKKAKHEKAYVYWWNQNEK